MNQGVGDQRSCVKKTPPSNKLSEAEELEILKICNLPENASKPPAQIVPTLADQGIYIASESTFYRVF